LTSLILSSILKPFRKFFLNIDIWANIIGIIRQLFGLVKIALII